jgi:hypothetical protein
VRGRWSERPLTSGQVGDTLDECVAAGALAETGAARHKMTSSNVKPSYSFLSSAVVPAIGWSKLAAKRNARASTPWSAEMGKSSDPYCTLAHWGVADSL